MVLLVNPLLAFIGRGHPELQGPGLVFTSPFIKLPEVPTVVARGAQPPALSVHRPCKVL